MANQIVAGNGTNNGLAVASDATGALNILTGSGAGTAAISIDSSQNVTAAANLSVTGNATITGTLSATNGITGSLKSATAQASTSGTSIDFTSIPSGVKRITVMFSGVSTGTASNPTLAFQLGTSSGVTTSGYLGSGGSISGSGAVNTVTNFSANFQFIQSASIANISHGQVIFNNLSGNIWTCNGSLGQSDTNRISWFSGSVTLSAVLDRVRITTGSGTDTFDAGSINIIYE